MGSIFIMINLPHSIDGIKLLYSTLSINSYGFIHKNWISYSINLYDHKIECL